jgi:glyoxylase-like metal-dependent hydrolase (beta-lactamase superfamily II)
MKKIVFLATCVAVAACSQTNTPPAATTAGTTAPVDSPVPAAAAAPAIKLYAMNCGDLEFADVDMFADDGSMKGVARTFVDPCYLIRHPAGDLLWDSGLPDAVADAPDGVRPERFPVHLMRSKKLVDELAELGLTPPDIEYLSFSHMHFDHTGNANLFAASTWIVDADERAAMFADKSRGSDEFANYGALENAKTVQIEGDADFDVFGDGSVVIHQAPGHTPGPTVLLVKLPQSGAVLLTGDMWHLAESREKRLVPTFNFNREQTLASMDKVEALAKATGARVVRQHVAEDFAAMPAFPTPLQ